jgi:allantoate deiminase
MARGWVASLSVPIGEIRGYKFRMPAQSSTHVLKGLLAGAEQISRRRRLTCEWTLAQDHGAVVCSPALTGPRSSSIRAVRERRVALVSGARHDAVVMSAVTPVALLLVRCRDGLSHHPAEQASPGDLEVALRVTVDFLERFARTSSS